MQKNTRFRLRIGVSLAVLGASVAGLVALVWSGLPSPRLPVETVTTAKAPDEFTPIAISYTIQLAETRKAVRLQKAFDRIGFDLNAVQQGYISVPRVLLASLPQDIDDLDTLSERKVLFLRALLPVILHVNDQIGIERNALLAVRDKMAAGTVLNDDEVRWMLDMADRYDQPDADADALLKKVDVIPPSLALAQAIEESGWGTSRIARRQNSLFGQIGTDVDYQAFSTLADATASYAHNLNTHRAYREFRQARAVQRRKGDLDGRILVGSLKGYSERGGTYVEALRTVIRANNLDGFDSARLNRLTVATIVASNQ